MALRRVRAEVPTYTLRTGSATEGIELLHNRWWVAVGAVLIQLCLGAIYAWSVFTPGLVAAGWTKMQTQIVFSVGLAAFAAVMVLAGRKLAIWGPRRLAISGGVTLGLGYLIAGLSGGTGFVPVLLGVGLVGGAGIGLAYVVPIAVGIRWFPDRRGFITGVAVAGFGFGALGWVKLAGEWGQLIETVGLGGTFAIYGVVFTVLIVIGSTWMRFPPEGWAPIGFHPQEISDSGGVVFTPREMLRTPQFHLISLTFAVSAGAGLMAIGLMKLYPVEALTNAGMSAVEASAVAGTAMAVFFSIANGVGRLAWGALSDRIGRKLSIIVMAAAQGVLMFAFVPMAGVTYLLYIAAALIGFNFGGNFALFPAITADRFGNATVGVNYPWVFLAYGFGGIAFPILGGWLGDMENFPLAFAICGAACLLGAVAAFLVFPPHHNEAEHRFTLKRFLHNVHLFENEDATSSDPSLRTSN
jgi:OFA family oxalate/formate antiporter-like MFS transporter